MFTRLFRRSWLLLAVTMLSGGCASSGAAACRDLPGTVQEIAASPRDDENLELLALRLSEGITAEEATYQRLVRDIASIRALDASMHSINYHSPYRGGALNVAFEDREYAKVRAGTYHSWDCLNKHFNVTKVSAMPMPTNGVSLTFMGRFSAPKLAALYSKLPGVRSAEPVIVIGGGPTIYVTPGIDAWHYVFANATGDCVAGCSESDAYHFVVDVDGKPSLLGSWHSDPRTSGRPPQWMQQYLTDVKVRWRQTTTP